MNNVINLETSAITSKYLIFITTNVFVGHFASWHNKLYRHVATGDSWSTPQSTLRSTLRSSPRSVWWISIAQHGRRGLTEFGPRSKKETMVHGSLILTQHYWAKQKILTRNIDHFDVMFQVYKLYNTWLII